MFHPRLQQKKLNLYVVLYKTNKVMKQEEEEIQEGKGKNHNYNEQQEHKLAVAAMSQSTMPTEMEKKHVYEVYDKIAPHFSHTRYKPWPKVEKFLNELEDGQMVLDVGCGNGKYLGVNKELVMVGTDRSIGLLQTANQKSADYQLFAADSLSLPVRSSMFDAFISIAVIHHFSNRSIRHRAINQLLRVIATNGVGLIYVWAFQQDGQQSTSKKQFTTQDVFVPWHLSFKFEGDLQKISHQGCEIDHGKRTVIYKRYYHVFKQGELQDLLSQHDNLQIEQSYYDRQNWCCKIRKIK